MKKAFLLFCMLFLGVGANASVKIYEGTIGKAKMELQVQFDGDYIESAIYAYNKFNVPILLKFIDNEEETTFYEYDEQGNHSATLHLNDLTQAGRHAVGQFVNVDDGRTYDVALKLKYDLVNNADFEEDIEVFQTASLDGIYFKAVIPKSSVDLYVIEVDLYNKKNGRLVQRIDLRNNELVEFVGANSVKTGDFNFDGIKDFSIFENSLNGNKFTLYYIYNPEDKSFQPLELNGASFEFNDITKTAVSSYSEDYGSKIEHSLFTLKESKFVLEKKYYSFYDEINDAYIHSESDERPDFLEANEIPRFAQYKGNIGGSKITLQAHFKKSGRIEAIYAYNDDEIPIVLNSTDISDNPIFHEYDEVGNHTATLTFTDFSLTNRKISGSYNYLKTNKIDDISLSLEKAYVTRDDYRLGPKDVFQRESTKHVFFKTRVGNWHFDEQRYPNIYFIDIYSKKTSAKLGYGVDMKDDSESRFMVFDNVKIQHTALINEACAASEMSDLFRIPDFSVYSSLSEYTKTADGLFERRQIN